MFKKLLTIFALLSTLAFAQDLDSLLSVLENKNNDDEWMDLLSGDANIHMIYAQLAYESDSYFAGRDVGLNQPNYVAQVTYNYKQFTLAAAAVAYPALYPPLQAMAISANYRLPLTFPVNIDINYGRYFFSTENDTLSSIYPNGFGLGLSHYAKYWGASTDLALLTGSEGVTPQIEAALYGTFDLFTWNDKNTIAIKPEVQIYFGSETSAYARRPGNRDLAKISGPGDGQGYGNGPGDGPGNGGGQGTVIVYDTAFGLMNIAINFNLLATLGDFDIGVTIQNNRPRSVNTEVAYIPTTMIGVNAGYAFSFIGK